MVETSTEVVSGPFPADYESMNLLAYVVHISNVTRQYSERQVESVPDPYDYTPDFDYVDSWRAALPGQENLGIGNPGHGYFWEGPGVVYYAQ